MTCDIEFFIARNLTEVLVLFTLGMCVIDFLNLGSVLVRLKKTRIRFGMSLVQFGSNFFKNWFGYYSYLLLI